MSSRLSRSLRALAHTPRSIHHPSSPFPAYNMSQIASTSTSTSVQPRPSLNERYKPPQRYGMKELDKSAFDITVPILSVRLETSKIGPMRKHPALKGQILDLPKIRGITSDPSDENMKFLRLRINSEDQLPAATRELFSQEAGGFVQDKIVLGYDYWSTNDILTSILPITEVEEVPSSFTLTGHIGHVNLRDEWLPYKHIIGQVILDKNKNLRTVVNKLNNIHVQYRYFDMEVIAGDKDYITSANESGCTFTFDFSRVYWNSRLHHEHERLINIFQPGEVIADVMAGVGPFAIPSAKKGCFVLGNDLNPESVKWMRENRVVNKVENTLRITEDDGREFIQKAPLQVWQNPFPPYISRSDQKKRQKEERHRREQLKLANSTSSPPTTSIPSINQTLQPQMINHYVMNLPDSALEFLDAFNSSFTLLLDQPNFPGLDVPMPMIHVHCFTRELERERAILDICQRASHYLSYQISSEDPDFNLHLVRSVAPNKDMYCLSFRLPREVAFKAKTKSDA